MNDQASDDLEREVARAIWAAMVDDEPPDDETLWREGYLDGARAAIAATGDDKAGMNDEPTIADVLDELRSFRRAVFDDLTGIRHRLESLEQTARIAELKAEVEELRKAIETHRAAEYSDLPGDCDVEFIVALAQLDAALYAVLDE